jgi:hypothetical protein
LTVSPPVPLTPQIWQRPKIAAPPLLASAKPPDEDDDDDAGSIDPETAAILDGPPPAVPPPAAIAPSTDFALRSFDEAIGMLKRLKTKSATLFTCTEYSADDLKAVMAFLGAVADRKGGA